MSEKKCDWQSNKKAGFWKESWFVQSKISGWEWLLKQSDSYLLEVYAPAENVGPIRSRLKKWIEEANVFLQSPECIHKELEIFESRAEPQLFFEDSLFQECISKFFSHPIIEKTTSSDLV